MKRKGENKGGKGNEREGKRKEMKHGEKGTRGEGKVYGLGWERDVRDTGENGRAG